MTQTRDHAIQIWKQIHRKRELVALLESIRSFLERLFDKKESDISIAGLLVTNNINLTDFTLHNINLIKTLRIENVFPYNEAQLLQNYHLLKTNPAESEALGYDIQKDLEKFEQLNHELTAWIKLKAPLIRKLIMNVSLTELLNKEGKAHLMLAKVYHNLAPQPDEKQFNQQLSKHLQQLATFLEEKIQLLEKDKERLTAEFTKKIADQKARLEEKFPNRDAARPIKNLQKKPLVKINRDEMEKNLRASIQFQKKSYEYFSGENFEKTRNALQKEAKKAREDRLNLEKAAEEKPPITTEEKQTFKRKLAYFKAIEAAPKNYRKINNRIQNKIKKSITALTKQQDHKEQKAATPPSNNDLFEQLQQEYLKNLAAFLSNEYLLESNAQIVKTQSLLKKANELRAQLHSAQKPDITLWSKLFGFLGSEAFEDFHGKIIDHDPGVFYLPAEEKQQPAPGSNPQDPKPPIKHFKPDFPSSTASLLAQQFGSKDSKTEFSTQPDAPPPPAPAPKTLPPIKRSGTQRKIALPPKASAYAAPAKDETVPASPEPAATEHPKSRRVTSITSLPPIKLSEARSTSATAAKTPAERATQREIDRRRTFSRSAAAQLKTALGKK